MSRISDWQIIERSEQAAISIHIKVPLKDMQSTIDNSRQKLTRFLQEKGRYPVGAFYVAYYSFSKEAVVLEAGFPLNKPIASENQFEASQQAGGVYLTCYHQGAYRKIPKVYQEMDAWLIEHDFETNGVTEEIYLNHDVEEKLLLTQVLIPIKKISQKEPPNDK